MDLSKVTENDLHAIASGDMSGVSSDTLQYLANGGQGEYRQTVGNPDASPDVAEKMRQDFVKSQGGISENLRYNKAGTASDLLKEPVRLAGEAVTAPINALMRGLKSTASLVQGGGEAIRQGSIDAGLEKFRQKQAEFQPMQSPFQPSGTGKMLSDFAQTGTNALSDLTGRPDIVQPVAQGAMDIAALYGLKAAAPSLARGAKAVVRGAVNSVPDTLEMSMYQRGLKGNGPFNGLKTSELNNRLNTALNEGIPLTEGGVNKLKTTVADINNEVQQRITDYADQGATVDMNKVIEPVAGVQAQANNTAFPNAANRQIAATVDEFKNNPAIDRPGVDPVNSNPTTEIPLDQAQRFKQSINKELNDFYESMNKSPDKTSFLARQWVSKTKAKIGDGLRAQISEVFPEVQALNQREGSLIQLNKSLERAVTRIGQRDIVSLKFINALANSPKTAIAEFILNNPKIQSNLAIVIRKARNKVNGVDPAATPTTFTPYTPPPKIDPTQGATTRIPTNLPVGNRIGVPQDPLDPLGLRNLR